MSIFKDIALIGRASGTIEALEQELVALRAQLDLLRDAKNQADSEMKQLRAEHKDTQEENDLILSQLHEAQEELERYFIDYHEAKKQNELNQKRIDRILINTPRYFNYESIACERDPIYSERYRWRVTDLIMAGRSWDNFEFSMMIEEGIAGIIFAQDDEGNSPLAVWPSNYANRDELECIPAGYSRDVLEERAKILGALSTSDWRLLTILPEMLAIAIEQKKVDIDDARKWIAANLRLLDILANKIPKKLRFDNVELLNYLVHPGYEHLSFRLHNLSFGDIHHLKFEFRLGCSNISKHRFGTHPRLEFPLVDSQPQLESWFAESEDEFGPKLELRFLMPRTLDNEVWSQLTQTDQQIIKKLIEILPRLINATDNQIQEGPHTTNEWLSVTEKMNFF